MTEQHPLAETLTLRDAFEQFVLPDLDNPRSADDRRCTLNRWDIWSDNLPVGQITKQTLIRFRDASQAAGNSPSTTNKHLRNLRTILRRLGPAEYRNPEGEGIIPKIPHIKFLPVEHSLPRVVPLDVLSDLYDACGETHWPEDLIPPAEWWKGLLVLAFNVCLRRGDLLNLSTENIDLDERIISIRAGKTKKQQVIPLNAVALTKIRRLWSPRPNLFGKIISNRHGERQFSREWHRLQTAAGIEEQEHFEFHDIRRTGLTAYETVKPGVSSYLGGHLPQSQLNGMVTMKVTKQFYISAPQVIIDAAEELPQPEAFKRILDDPQAGESIIPLNDATCRTDWKFGIDWAEFRGTRFHLAARPLAALRAFVAAGKPLAVADLREVVFWDKPDVSDNTIKGAVHRLRQTLLKHLSLPARFDPVKSLPDGNAWLLRIY